MNYYLWIDNKSHGPYDIEQIRQMLDDRTITTETLCHTEGSSGDKWHPISNVVPLYASTKPVVAQSVQVHAPSAASQPQLDTTPKPVSIQDIDIPFGSMVWFMVKWAIASIPAAIILTMIFFLINAFVVSFYIAVSRTNP